MQNAYYTAKAGIFLLAVATCGINGGAETMRMVETIYASNAAAAEALMAFKSQMLEQAILDLLAFLGI